MRTFLRLLLSLLMVSACFAVAQAQITHSKYLEFDQDGVLPSSEPDIEFRNQYHSALEPGLFSVSGGVLRGDSMPSGSNYFGYAWPNALLNASIPFDTPMMLEARLRVLEVNQHNVNSPIGSMSLWTAHHHWHVYHTTDAIRITPASGAPISYPFDVSQWHTIRMVGVWGYFDVYVDGVPIATNVPSPAEGLGGWQIQLTDNLSGAVVEWDYVHFEAGPDAVPAEELSWGGVKNLFR